MTAPIVVTGAKMLLRHKMTKFLAEKSRDVYGRFAMRRGAEQTPCTHTSPCHTQFSPVNHAVRGMFWHMWMRPASSMRPVAGFRRAAPESGVRSLMRNLDRRASPLNDENNEHSDTRKPGFGLRTLRASGHALLGAGGAMAALRLSDELRQRASSMELDPALTSKANPQREQVPAISPRSPKSGMDADASKERKTQNLRQNPFSRKPRPDVE